MTDQSLPFLSLLYAYPNAGYINVWTIDRKTHDRRSAWFTTAQLDAAAAAAPTELGELVDWLFNPSLANDIEEEEERVRVLRDMGVLRNAAHQAASAPEVDSLSGLVGWLRYRIATRMPFDDATPPRVQITTLHSAKGLQADRVIIAGLADQMIPGRAAAGAEREERRRLLYVAVTRSR